MNVTAMDFRQYDNALGRFLNPDRLSELAPGITPYRFAFNNPNYWNDPTGLFETRALALAHISNNNLTGADVFENADGTFSILHQVGSTSYTITMIADELVISGTIETVSVGGSSGGGGGSGSSGGYSGGGYPSFGGSYFSGWGGNSSGSSGMGGYGGGGFSSAEMNSINTLVNFGAMISTAININSQINANYQYKYGTQTQSAKQLTELNKVRMLKIAKNAGRLSTGLSIYSTYNSGMNVYNQYQAGGIENVNGWDVADTAVGVVGLGGSALVTLGLISNPVGWVIGAGVLIYGGIRLVQDLNGSP